YIHKHHKDFNNLIWINAESHETLIDSFHRLAQDKLGIRTKNADGSNKNEKSILEEIYQFFAERKKEYFEKSLFIFDNAEKCEILDRFLPHLGENLPYILVTSRNREWESGIEVLNLSELEFKDAIELVKKGLGNKSGS